MGVRANDQPGAEPSVAFRALCEAWIFPGACIPHAGAGLRPPPSVARLLLALEVFQQRRPHFVHCHRTADGRTDDRIQVGGVTCSV